MLFSFKRKQRKVIVNNVEVNREAIKDDSIDLKKEYVTEILERKRLPIVLLDPLWHTAKEHIKSGAIDKAEKELQELLKEQGRLNGDTIVTTIMSNLGLYKACDKVGLKYEKTAVGDKYVYENMLQNGFQLGGEQSGHIIFKEYATTGDGILTSLKLMEVMLAQKRTLSQLCEGLTIYPQELKSVRVKDQKAALAAPAVKAAIEEVKQALGNTGRILVRCSGTEPVVRVMVEAPTQQICKAQVEKIAQLLQQADQNL